MGLEVLENALDALSHLVLSFGRVQLLHAHPETAVVALCLASLVLHALLVIQLAEDKVEQFPKGIFGVSFVAIDVVVTTLEGLYQ